MINPSRRDILKAIAAAGLAPALPLGFRHMAFAAETNSPLLIVLHLRGGCDGLNLISPANDPTFVDARASDLRVLDSGKDAGFALANGLGTTIDFRLHNAAGGLAELYKNGDLAFVHAAGLTDATRSHFVATDMIEAGVGQSSDLARSENGWITRGLQTVGHNAAGLDAVAVSAAIAGDLRGSTSVLAAPDINNGLPVEGGPSVAAALWQMYGTRRDMLGEAGRLAMQQPAIIDQHVERDAGGHIVPYAAQNGANYEAAGGFSSVLKSVARLVKMDVGLRAITLDYGAWDTHEYQPGRFRGLVDPLSTGLAAFWNDLTAYHKRVTLVMVTEFGRRLRSNKSNGTDHGRASVMTVLGGGVRGGRMYGTWPGLATQQLDEGVDLAVTTDYRQVFTEAMNHVGVKNAAAVFPGFQPKARLGIFDKA